MYQILMVVLLFVALAIIGLVLLQQGKGSGMGASFGAGASATLFGSGGSGNFLSRTTGVLVAIFFILCLALGNLTNREINRVPVNTDSGEFDPTNIQSQLPNTPSVVVPAAPATSTPALPGESTTPANQPEIPQ